LEGLRRPPLSLVQASSVAGERGDIVGYRKYVVAMVLVVTAVRVFPQYLAPVDIDVFIEGQEALSQEVRDNFKRSELLTWIAYGTAIDTLYKGFTALYEAGMTGEEWTALSNTYHKFMEAKVPGVFGRGLEKMGWHEKGHQKYWTIVFGVLYLQTDEDPGLSEETRVRMGTLLGRSDLGIITNRLGDITERGAGLLLRRKG
jgi:hypothetical protein